MKLIVAAGPFEGTVFELQPGNNLVGRWDPDEKAFPEIDLEEVDVDAKVSRKHAVVFTGGGKISVKDIGSLNGTSVNSGLPLEHGVEVPLSFGDEIIFGKVIVRVSE